MANLWNQGSNNVEEKKNDKVILNSYDEKNHVTVITDGMTVTGNIVTDGDIVLEGKVIGDISCNDLKFGKLGVLQGNITANNVTLSNSLKSNVSCKGLVYVNEGTHHDGDIVADKVICEGSITGNVKCTTSLQLKSNGTIKGNCTSYCFNIEDGAVLNGKLTTKRKE